MGGVSHYWSVRVFPTGVGLSEQATVHPEPAAPRLLRSRQDSEVGYRQGRGFARALKPTYMPPGS